MDVKVNLKEIERKAYTSYHQDGLIDVFAGFIILSFGPWLMTDMAWMPAVMWIVGVSAYTAAKRAFTIPRIGFVKLAQHRAKALYYIAVMGFSLSALLGAVVFMEVEGGSLPLWLLLASEYHMPIIGLSLAASFCAVGYALRIRRMYAYALLATIMFAVGYFLYYPLQYYVILLGTLILLSGLALLVHFIRDYPLRTPGSMGDDGSEGQRSQR